MTRLRLWWGRAFWVIPAIGLVLALVLADLSSDLDEALFTQSGAPLISGAAATTMLAAVGGAMVTFTGFVFSLVLLLMQFGSSQYSPRTVAFFLRARSTQVILAIFLATSLFCFVTLTGVGSEGRQDFAPEASVVIATLLLTASLVAFIALMHLVSKRIRIDAVVTSLGGRTRDTLTRTEVRLAAARRAYVAPGEPVLAQHPVRYVGRSGQVVAIDARRLTRLARRRGLSVELFVLVGDGLASGRVVGRASRPGQDRAVSRCLVAHGERALTLDPTYGLRILADIALKALSPAVNDPTTAVRCLDEIEGVLRLASRLPLQPLRLGHGSAHVLVPVVDWAGIVDVGVHEIRLAGLEQPQVSRRLVGLLSDLAADLPAERSTCVLEQLHLLQQEVAGRVDAHEVRFALWPDRQGIGGGNDPSGTAPGPARSGD